MGVPKAKLRIGDRPILQYLLERFQWPGPTLLVTAPGLEQPAGAEGFDREVTDAVSGEGPLRGVLTALQQVRGTIVIFTTVDMPGLSRVQLEWMVEQLSARPAVIGLMGTRVVSGQEQIEPFPFASRVGAAEVIGGRLQQGRRSVQSLTELEAFAVCSTPANWPESAWANLNFPADFESFLTRAER
jgi:molybdopterin-guanine dinucleotide biosynthesis protein A